MHSTLRCGNLYKRSTQFQEYLLDQWLFANHADFIAIILDASDEQTRNDYCRIRGQTVLSHES